MPKVDERLPISLASGTSIITRAGAVPVERLAPGDPVLTMDRGFQPLRWIGRQVVTAMDQHAPITIDAGAVRNERDLVASPDTRLLIGRRQCLELFGTPSETLVPVRCLVGLPGFARTPMPTIAYFHMIFDTHEIIYAEGIPCESLNPCSDVLMAMSVEMREQAKQVFPELALQRIGNVGGSARPTLEARLRAGAVRQRRSLH